MNKILFLLTLSVALFSCTDPLCEDPNAINYGDLNNMCQYESYAHFYVSASTLEMMREKAPNNWPSFYVRLNTKNGSQSNYFNRYMFIDSLTDLQSTNFGEPTDCDHFYSNSLVNNVISNNPSGRIEELYVTLEYEFSENIRIWEGEIHMDPADPCKIIEVIYE